jgi:hypothetical protein
LLRKSKTLSGSDVFTFHYPDAVSFDSDVPDPSGSGFSVKLGQQSYHVAGTGQGIMVAAIGQDLASPVGSVEVDLSGGADDLDKLEGLATRLNTEATAYGPTIVMQTWGNPKAHTIGWGDVGDALTQYGGTSSVWDELDGTGNYALVARAGAGSTSALQSTASAEASAPLTAKNMNANAKPWAGTIRGVLGRGPDSLPVVTASTTLPTVGENDQNGNRYQASMLDLIPLAEAAPQPWPLSDPTHTKALQWISQQLDLGDPNSAAPGDCYQPTTWDLRAEYCNSNLTGDWATDFQKQMDALTVSDDSNGFTEADLQAVQKQLDAEFPTIQRVMSLFSTLQSSVDNSQGTIAADFNTATDAVTNSLTTTVPDSPYNMASFVSAFLGPMTSLAAPESAGSAPFAIGVFSSALEYALGGVTDQNGNPALDSFTASKDQIGEEAQSRLQQGGQQFALLEQVILTDWNKLSTTAYNAKNVWSTNDWDAGSYTDVVQAATKQWLYKTMVPLAYSQMWATPAASIGGNTTEGLNNYACSYQNYPTSYSRWPFQPGSKPDLHGNPSGGRQLPDSAAFAPLTATTADGTATSPFIWGLGNTNNSDWLHTPTSALTDPLFQTVDQGGVGLYKEQFYSWGWVSGNRYQLNSPAILKQLGNAQACG